MRYYVFVKSSFKHTHEECESKRAFLLRAVLNILMRNASPRGPMCFRCLIFNLSGPCELLFLLCFIASWT